MEWFDKDTVLLILATCIFGFALAYILERTVPKRFRIVTGLMLFVGGFLAIALLPVVPGTTFIFIALPVVGVSLIVGKTSWF